ncbi:MAG: hypothetical protein ACFFBD_22290, partial [Candidatus Hodarchaeota archaeon]
ISDPQSPRVVGQWRDGGEALSVQGNNTHLYIADLLEGVELLNITDPIYPYELGQYSTAPHSIFSVGNYVYVADQDDGFIILEFHPTSSSSSVSSSSSSSTSGISGFLGLTMLSSLLLLLPTVIILRRRRRSTL